LSDGPLLLLSPHPDDAALSCAALLAREKPIDVLTALAGDPDPPVQGQWDLVTGFGDSAESRAVRLAEETAAFARGPHRLTLLDLLEVQHLVGPRKPADAEAINKAVSSWVDRNPGGTVVIPACAGRAPGRIRTRVQRLIRSNRPARHPDHVFVREATLDALDSRNDAHLLLYEEFPYRWGGTADAEVKRVADARSFSTELLVVRVDRLLKVARIGAYPSQTRFLSVGEKRVDTAEDLPEDERYWLVTERLHGLAPKTRSGAR